MIHDMYGNELQIGDHVCFIQSLNTAVKELVRAKVAGLEKETGKRASWTEGWVILEEIQPEYLQTSPWLSKPLPKKKAASCCIKCF